MKKTKVNTPPNYNGELASYAGFAIDSVKSSLEGLKTVSRNLHEEETQTRAKIRELEAHCVELEVSQRKILGTIDKLDEFLKGFADSTEIKAE